MLVAPDTLTGGRYFDGSGRSLRRIAFGFETDSAPSGVGLDAESTEA